jgi:hypothetical protein
MGKHLQILCDGAYYISQKSLLDSYYGIRNDLITGYNEQDINLIQSDMGVNRNLYCFATAQPNFSSSNMNNMQ